MEMNNPNKVSQRHYQTKITIPRLKLIYTKQFEVKHDELHIAMTFGKFGLYLNVKAICTQGGVINVII